MRRKKITKEKLHRHTTDLETELSENALVSIFDSLGFGTKKKHCDRIAIFITLIRFYFTPKSIIIND